MNWILDETIYNLKSRISALEKVINNEEVNRIYKMSKVEEIKRNTTRNWWNDARRSKGPWESRWRWKRK